MYQNCRALLSLPGICAKVSLMHYVRRCFYCFLILLASSLLFTSSSSGRISRLAPEFRIADLSGESISLSDLHKDGYALLVFFSTRCHYCTAMIPQFKAIDKKYRSKGIRLAAVNIGFESQPEVVRYANKHHLTYLILNEDAKKADIAEAFNLVGTPTILMVDATGHIVYRGYRLPDLKNWLRGSR